MDQTLLKIKYINRFLERGLSFPDGFTAYEAGLDDPDFQEDPVEAAAEELSYYQD